MPNLQKLVKKLAEDGWELLDQDLYPPWVVKGKIRIQLDPDVIDIYWLFKGYETITYIPVPANAKYTQLFRKIKDVVDRIVKIQSL